MHMEFACASAPWKLRLQPLPAPFQAAQALGAPHLNVCELVYARGRGLERKLELHRARCPETCCLLLFCSCPLSLRLPDVLCFSSKTLQQGSTAQVHFPGQSNPRHEHACTKDLTEEGQW